jgi:hypothetical protein
MCKRTLTFFAGALSGILVAGDAHAAPIGAASSVHEAASSMTDIVNVQSFYWHGKQYCRYSEGRYGDGWYRCGYDRRIAPSAHQQGSCCGPPRFPWSGWLGWYTVPEWHFIR